MKTSGEFSLFKHFRRLLLRLIPEVLSVSLLIAGWHLISRTIPSFLLPSPLSTFQETYKTLFSYEFAHNAVLTLKRSLAGFLVAFAVAHILIFSSVYSDTLKNFWKPIVLLGLSIPATIGIFVTVVMLGSRGPIALIVVIIILTPLLFLMLQPTYIGINKKLTEMSKIYRLPTLVFLRYVIIPQIAPSYMSAIRAGINDAWKLTILAEVFSFGDGVGHQILTYFNLFSIKQVLAWFISFLAILVIFEYGVFQSLEKLLIPNLKKV